MVLFKSIKMFAFVTNEWQDLIDKMLYYQSEGITFQNLE